MRLQTGMRVKAKINGVEEICTFVEMNAGFYVVKHELHHIIVDSVEIVEDEEIIE